MLERSMFDFLLGLRTVSADGDEVALTLGCHPAALDLVVAIALLRFAAVDHEIVEEIVMARTLPHLRMHDDRAIETHHIERTRCSRQCAEFVVADDHVAPPGFLDVALQLDTERAVIPETIETTIDLA